MRNVTKESAALCRTANNAAHAAELVRNRAQEMLVEADALEEGKIDLARAARQHAAQWPELDEIEVEPNMWPSRLRYRFFEFRTLCAGEILKNSYSYMEGREEGRRAVRASALRQLDLAARKLRGEIGS